MRLQTDYYRNKLQYEMDPSDLFQELSNNNSYLIIDTRKKFAYKNEHIPGAINIPHLQMTRVSTEHLDKSKIYVCYCDGIGCNASTKGALKMAEMGFQVKELIGGITWWKIDGFATVGELASNGDKIKCAC